MLLGLVTSFPDDFPSFLCRYWVFFRRILSKSPSNPTRRVNYPFLVVIICFMTQKMFPTGARGRGSDTTSIHDPRPMEIWSIMPRCEDVDRYVQLAAIGP